MTVLLAALLLFTVTASFIALDRKDKRHADQITDLARRVQAPGAAHFEVPSDSPSAGFVPFDDDDAYHAAVRERSNA